MRFTGYKINSADGTMYNVTLTFDNMAPYTLTINFPDVKDKEDFSKEINNFAQQHIDNITIPHPLADLVGHQFSPPSGGNMLPPKGGQAPVEE